MFKRKAFNLVALCSVCLTYTESLRNEQKKKKEGVGVYVGEGNGNPLQYSCLENSTDRGALGGYSPWGC